MAVIGLMIARQLGFFRVDSFGKRLVVDGLAYDCRDRDDELVFYDLLDSPGRGLNGIEVHVDKHHPLFVFLRPLEYVTYAPYPRIWFGPPQEGEGRILEAFGGLNLYESSSDSWCILIDVDQWLEPQDRLTLERLATGEEKGDITDY